MPRPWTIALALALAACSSDLFHSTHWEPDCGADCDLVGSTVAAAGAAGGEGGSGSSVASTGHGAAGGSGGSGGSCVTCADALGTTVDDRTPFCAGSNDLYLGLKNACCDETSPNTCFTQCSSSLCASSPMTQACVDCAGTNCGATFVACQNDADMP